MFYGSSVIEQLTLNKLLKKESISQFTSSLKRQSLKQKFAEKDMNVEFRLFKSLLY